MEKLSMYSSFFMYALAYSKSASWMGVGELFHWMLVFLKQPWNEQDFVTISSDANN